MIYPIKFDKDNLDFIMGYIDECDDPEDPFDFYVNMFLRLGIKKAKEQLNDPEWFEEQKRKLLDMIDEGES